MPNQRNEPRLGGRSPDLHRRGVSPRSRIDWQQADALSGIDRDLAGRLAKDRNWFVTKQGHTLAVVYGPVEFTMGSPPYEPGRDKSNDELPHRVRIPRSFAISTKEVTVGQFHEWGQILRECKRFGPRL